MSDSHEGVHGMADGIVVSDGDDRAEQMLADPKGYFARARERARREVRREIEDVTDRRLRLHTV